MDFPRVQLDEVCAWDIRVSNDIVDGVGVDFPRVRLDEVRACGIWVDNGIVGSVDHVEVDLDVVVVVFLVVVLQGLVDVLTVVSTLGAVHVLSVIQLGEVYAWDLRVGNDIVDGVGVDFRGVRLDEVLAYSIRVDNDIVNSVGHVEGELGVVVVVFLVVVLQGRAVILAVMGSLFVVLTVVDALVDALGVVLLGDIVAAVVGEPLRGGVAIVERRGLRQVRVGVDVGMDFPRVQVDEVRACDIRVGGGIIEGIGRAEVGLGIMAAAYVQLVLLPC